MPRRGLDSSCNAPLVMGTGSSQDGTCQVKVASGAACAADAQCPDGDNCDDGTCKPATLKLPVCQ